MLLLSTLKKGDCFKFIEGQVALYLTNNNSAADFNTTDSHHIEFEVLKLNEKSIKVKQLYGRIEYVFKFKGVFSDYRSGVDCVIEKVVPMEIEINN